MYNAALDCISDEDNGINNVLALFLLKAYLKFSGQHSLY